MSIWEILDIEPTKDERAVKKAYALKARVTHPEDHPEDFQRLHEAYQAALRCAKSSAQRAPEPDAFFLEEPEDTEEPEDAQNLEEPEDTGAPGYAFDRLITQGLRAKQRELERLRLAVIGLLHRLAESDQRAESSAWESALSGGEFKAVQYMPAFVESLGAFLLAHKELSAQIWVLFFQTYEFDRVETHKERGNLDRLFEILYPRYRRLKQQEADRLRARRRSAAMACILAGVSPALLFLLFLLDVLWLLVPVTIWSAVFFVIRRFKLEERFESLHRGVRILLVLAGFALFVGLFGIMPSWGGEAGEFSNLHACYLFTLVPFLVLLVPLLFQSVLQRPQKRPL